MPAEPALNLTHEVRCTVPAPTAQNLAAFLSHVPDHATVEIIPDGGEWQQLVATWPHETSDDAIHARTCLQAYTPTSFDDDAPTPLEGAGKVERCEARWNDRPCIRPAGHQDGKPARNSPHVYQAEALGGDLYPRYPEPAGFRGMGWAAHNLKADQ